MSYPSPGQPGTGVPQQPYGSPAQPPYGAPGQPMPPFDGGAQQFAAPAKNGFATAGLILGILPTGIFGVVFSILGLVRAPKVGGIGRVKSWIGLVLSILWIAGSIALVSAAGKEVSKALNPGCISAEADATIWESNMEADSTDPEALQGDLQTAINELNADAGKSTNSAATTAIKKLSADIQQLLGDLKSGTVPSDAFTTQMDADGSAIDTACGH